MFDAWNYINCYAHGLSTVYYTYIKIDIKLEPNKLRADYNVHMKTKNVKWQLTPTCPPIIVPTRRHGYVDDKYHEVCYIIEDNAPQNHAYRLITSIKIDSTTLSPWSSSPIPPIYKHIFEYIFSCYKVFCFESGNNTKLDINIIYKIKTLWRAHITYNLVSACSIFVLPDDTLDNMLFMVQYGGYGGLCRMLDTCDTLDYIKAIGIL